MSFCLALLTQHEFIWAFPYRSDAYSPHVKCESQSAGEFVKTQIPGPASQDSDSVVICIFNKLFKSLDKGVPGPPFEKP